MTNKNILTYNAKVAQVEQAYYSPISTIESSLEPLEKNISSIYCFLGNVTPWPIDANTSLEIVSAPTQDQKYLKSVFKNMFVAKLITSSSISPVIQRVDWTSGITYDYYRDDIDLLAKDVNGLNVYNFYVRNSYGQVFKCLWNNKGTASLLEPFFQPGSIGTNNIFQSTDGYKWKYVYTIDKGSSQNFMDTNWMPVPVGNNTPNPLQTSSGCGDVEVINVTNGGYGYDPTTSPISIVINGDGVGATAYAVVSGSSITDIIVTNPGTNYTYASVSIAIGTLGSGAIFTTSTSPIGGHGFDPVSELGCNRVMYVTQFNGSEGGTIPTDIKYNQVGLLINPIDTTSYTISNIATDSIYQISTNISVASGSGTFSLGETITTGTFSATVLDFDQISNIVYLINITGTPTTNQQLVGQTSSCVRTVLNISNPKFVPQSGYLAYIENRSHTQRSVDGIEQFKFVLQF